MVYPPYPKRIPAEALLGHTPYTPGDRAFLRLFEAWKQKDEQRRNPAWDPTPKDSLLHKILGDRILGLQEDDNQAWDPREDGILGDEEDYQAWDPREDGILGDEAIYEEMEDYKTKMMRRLKKMFKPGTREKTGSRVKQWNRRLAERGSDQRVIVVTPVCGCCGCVMGPRTLKTVSKYRVHKKK